MTSDTDTLRAEILRHLPDPLPRRIGVAVSGGSDSTALLQLLAGIARTEGFELCAATVDHGLRAEAADEAVAVSRRSADLGVPHETLKWKGWDGSGNLQDQARRARYRLLAEWAQSHGIAAIALGHTADDQAETVLMRLARSAGVTGLSAMATVRRQDGIDLLRPLLSITRARLRGYLNAAGVTWIEDPSNRDTRFDRIKTREALTGLGNIGITAETLSRVAGNLAQARDALELFAQESARKIAVVESGDVCIDLNGFEALPQEIQRRILVGTFGWITQGGYPPRQSAVDQVVDTLLTRQTVSVGGCLVIPKGNNAWICRELNAVKDQTAHPGTPWDRRWVLNGPSAAETLVRPLGERGISRLDDWRLVGRPRAAILSSPAVWRGDELLSAPLAGYANGWSVELAPHVPDFYASFLSH
ncbi:tRNA lysidine(34) synthetase TilS [Roseibium sp. RKSG952]|uniref:tRNA lysidine(34) synthetase TilS n=1 Tax=Roseibium sp. RKSG952 TaxID=2529384 RepID=UPI0012BC7E84|nr:tRNA lysidine(34) synthetase TilS [Roseibium sp. RKSG952]MTH99375.1 tRNA lysidine(34) synthetase TilS [Roseibium sp. RKSG952]